MAPSLETLRELTLKQRCLTLKPNLLKPFLKNLSAEEPEVSSDYRSSSRSLTMMALMTWMNMNLEKPSRISESTSLTKISDVFSISLTEIDQAE